MRVRWMVLLGVMMTMLVVLFSGCGSKANNTQGAAKKIKVVATIYPVYEFAKQVGGDKVEVTMLVPPGAEPHDWEPTIKDIGQIKAAKLFLYQGAGFEPIKKILSKDVIGDIPVVEVSKGIPLLTKTTKEEDEHQDSDKDVHVWLDPVDAQQEVNTIAEALINIDPQHKDYYQKNAESYNQKLGKLDQEYKTALANLAHRDIVTSHAAFGYLANRYNLDQVAIMGLNPDTEPTPEKMAKVVDFCRAHNVKYIFFETVVSPKLSETIAKETGAGLLVLNPVESLTKEEINQGKDYIGIMKENLINLQKALQ